MDNPREKGSDPPRSKLCFPDGGRASTLTFFPVLLALAFSFSCATPFDPVVETVLPITPSDPAKVAARDATLSKLAALRAEGFVASGQNAGHVGWSLTAGPMSVGGRVPAVMGIDLGYDDLSGDFTEAIDLLDEHAALGGLVEISFCPPNPVSSGDAWDKTTVDFVRLAAPGDPLNDAFMGLISNLGNILQRLEDRDVVVFLRPLHEMNGGWFWWGNDEAWPDPASWKKLWRQIHDYLVLDRALDNVLFVYCPNALTTSTCKSVSYFYPGTDYVDVIGLDYYADTLGQFNARGGVDEVVALGKPLGMFEVGSLSRVHSFDQRTWAGLVAHGASSFIAWHSWKGNEVALAHCSYGSELLALDEVLDLVEWATR